MNERLREFADFLISVNLVNNYSELAKTLGLDRSQLSSMMTGNRKITHKTVKIICMVYPFLNAEWLVSGIGPMTSGDIDNNLSTHVNKDVDNGENVHSYKPISAFSVPILEDSNMDMPEVVSEDFIHADEYRRVCNENTELRIAQARLMDKLAKYKEKIKKLGHEC